MDDLCRTKSPRDGRLDMLRGLCMINMLIVHMIEQGLTVSWGVNELMMHVLRFAAGGFILTSGLCIGAIHYQRALNPEKRFATYRGLLKRAGIVLLVHYFATFASLALVPLRGFYEYDATLYVRDVLLLWTGYELLLFYVVMLLISPLLIEITRRIGLPVVGIASCCLFFAWYDNPHLYLYGVENHFPLLRWQLVFVMGVLAGSRLRSYDTLPQKTKIRILAVSASCAAIVAALSAVERYGEITLPWWLTVTKTPLSPVEVVRYLSLVVAMGVTLDLCWHRIGATSATKIIQLIGAQSLLLWVAHIPIVAVLVGLNALTATVLALLIVILIAWSGRESSRYWARNARRLPQLHYTAPVAGSLLMIALLTQAQKEPMQIASDIEQASDETIFFDNDPMEHDEPIMFDDDDLDQENA